MPPLRVPDNLTDLAYKAIRQSILNDPLVATERLIEARLAADLGISKSPIREALHRLSAEGLIEISPRRGAIVVTYGPEEVAQLFELRVALESLALTLLKDPVRLAAELRKIVAACATCVRERDVQRFIDEDRRFHLALVSASSNRFLVDAYRNLQDRIQLVRLQTVGLPGRPNRAHEEHKAILAALEIGDFRTMEHLLREHILAVQRDAVSAARSAPQPPAAGDVLGRRPKRGATR